MSEYWLYISVSTKATLKDIDKFLRDIWLECCGHFSAFTIEGEHYASDSKRMSTKVDRVLFEELSFIHEYDFGSTTTLKSHIVKLIATFLPNELQMVSSSLSTFLALN